MSTLSVSSRTLKGMVALFLTLGCVFYIAWAMDHRYEPMPPLSTHFASFNPDAPKPSAGEQWSDTWLWVRYFLFAPPLRPYWGIAWALLFGKAALRCFFQTKTK